jgi:hypothetical protein
LDAIIPLTSAELAGSRIALHYVHQNNDSAINPTTVGADFLTFNADGTGITSRRNFPYVWEIDPDGVAFITFANGDVTQYYRYNVTGEISKAVGLGLLATGGSVSVNTEIIEYDGVTDFSEPMLVNRRYRLTRRIIWGQPPIDLILLPGGSGCRLSNSPILLEWQSTPENWLDAFQFGRNDLQNPAQHRSWEAVTVIPGEQGDRYWMLQILDTSFGDPNYNFKDPTVTPGGFGSWEFVEDVTGQADPCGFGPPPVTYDEQVDGDISGTFGLGPVFELGAGTNTIVGVGNGPDLGNDPDPSAFFDFDIFSITVPSGLSLTSITLENWGLQTAGPPVFIRVRPCAQPTSCAFQWSINGNQPTTTPQSIAAEVAAIPLNLPEYTINNSGSLVPAGVPYRWTFVVE